jgi:acyl carrier protein
VNTSVRVLDRGLRDCPPAVPGQLFIGGEGVSSGYLGRPELTRERFIERNGQRLYATGDQVKLVNGELEFLGREDNQVKVRGYRIELGEIESWLAKESTVHEAAAAVQEGRWGHRELIGYYTATREIDAKSLRRSLGQNLPEYMVPSRFVHLDAMPRTPNGKIDKKNLGAARPKTRERVLAPVAKASGDTQQSIARIWQDLLGIEQIDVNANFFDIGGHSILVIRLQGMLSEKFGRKVPVSDLFRFPTIEAFAKHLDGTVTPANGDSAARQSGSSRAERRRQARARRQ